MIDALEFRATALTAGQTCDAAALAVGGICRRHGVPSGYRKPEPVAQESQCGALLPSNADEDVGAEQHSGENSQSDLDRFGNQLMTIQQSFEPEGGSDTRRPDALRVRPLRAAGKTFRQVHYPRRTIRAIGDGFLWLAAVGGFICIGLVIAASIFNISLIMFKTGSMSPTIPAGSVALVREIPAIEVGIGDIITVDRPGNLPVTHRVTEIKAMDNGQWSLSMKGDANELARPVAL